MAHGLTSTGRKVYPAVAGGRGATATVGQAAAAVALPALSALPALPALSVAAAPVIGYAAANSQAIGAAVGNAISNVRVS